MLVSLIVLGLFAQSPPSEPDRIEEKVINVVAIGESPQAASGYVWTSTLLLGQDENGDIDPYFVTYHGPNGSSLPPLCGRCTIRYTTGHRLEIVGGLWTRRGLEGAFIQDFECSPSPDPGT